MTITKQSTLLDVIRAVSPALKRHGIRAVLTGGACATVHSRGAYLSNDLDYIIEGRATRTQLDAAMADVGFSRQGAAYVHSASAFFVEFPAGPLGIGDDDLVKPVEIRVGRARVLALSATDSCRDRLAAFYHWNDRQSLRVAAAIAMAQRVDMRKIREWSTREGHTTGFAEFRRALR